MIFGVLIFHNLCSFIPKYFIFLILLYMILCFLIFIFEYSLLVYMQKQLIICLLIMSDGSVLQGKFLGLKFYLSEDFNFKF